MLEYILPIEDSLGNLNSFMVLYTSIGTIIHIILGLMIITKKDYDDDPFFEQVTVFGRILYFITMMNVLMISLYVICYIIVRLSRILSKVCDVIYNLIMKR